MFAIFIPISFDQTLRIIFCTVWKNPVEYLKVPKIQLKNRLIFLIILDSVIVIMKKKMVTRFILDLAVSHKLRSFNFFIESPIFFTHIIK